MSITIRKAGAAAALLTALAAPLVLADSALAQGGGGHPAVRTSGHCTGGGTYQLKAKVDDGRIQVEYEVDTNHVGQQWTVTLTDNGKTVFTGMRTTNARSGSFTVEKLITNRVGSDTIKAHATRGAHSCGGTVVS